MKHNLENYRSSYDDGVHLHDENLSNVWQHDGAFTAGGHLIKWWLIQCMVAVIFKEIVVHLLHVGRVWM